MPTFTRRTRTDPKQAAQALAAEVAVVERIAAMGTNVLFGAPTRCPDCGDFALVDLVVEAVGVQENRCLRCETTWIITRRALAMLARRPLPPPGVAVPTAPRSEPAPSRFAKRALRVADVA